MRSRGLCNCIFDEFLNIFCKRTCGWWGGCFLVMNGVETRPLGMSLTRLGVFFDGVRSGRDEGAQKPQIVGVIRRFVGGGGWGGGGRWGGNKVETAI